jgi:hypothetical protein
MARRLDRMGELGQEEEDDGKDAPRLQEQEGEEGSEDKVDEEKESSENDADEVEEEESNGAPATGGASEGSMSDDSGGAQAGVGDGAGAEEPQKKTRIFEVVQWALRSLVKMRMFTLIDAVTLCFLCLRNWLYLGNEDQKSVPTHHISVKNCFHPRRPIAM